MPSPCKWSLCNFPRPRVVECQTFRRPDFPWNMRKRRGNHKKEIIYTLLMRCLWAIRRVEWRTDPVRAFWTHNCCCCSYLFAGECEATREQINLQPCLRECTPRCDYSAIVLAAGAQSQREWRSFRYLRNNNALKFAMYSVPIPILRPFLENAKTVISLRIAKLIKSDHLHSSRKNKRNQTGWPVNNVRHKRARPIVDA